MSDPNDIHSTAFLPVTAHDAKTEIEQIDVSKELSDTDPHIGSSPLIVSAYADYTTGATIRLFKRLFIAGFLVSFSGIYLGFTLNVPGSVIANKGESLSFFCLAVFWHCTGFVQQFGTVIDAQGELQLNAQYVGLWSAINFVSQVIFQFLSPFTANRFGLKANMYTFTALITLVSLCPGQTLIKLTHQATILEIIARTWYVYLIAKIVCGFAAGFIGTSVMAYTSEITMPKMRGVHLSAFSLAYAIGGGACAIALEVIQQASHQPLLPLGLPMYWLVDRTSGISTCFLLSICDSRSLVADSGLASRVSRVVM
jgi:MFS family permease